MQADNFDLDAYFARIGHDGNRDASIANLAEIMRRQIYTIPFENIDVQAGKIVSLVPEEIVSKVVDGGRGGYCYELNGLFAMALQALGIPYVFAAARPLFYPMRRPRTHMVVIATMGDERWLCDLGFGSYGISEPVSLSHANREIRQGHDLFRLATDNGRDYVLQAKVGEEWVSQYGFDEYPQEWIDFMPANYLNSTHPDTIFVQKLLVLRHHPEGRDILLDDSLKSIRKGVTSVRSVAAEEVGAVLDQVFGLPAGVWPPAGKKP